MRLAVISAALRRLNNFLREIYPLTQAFAPAQPGTSTNSDEFNATGRANTRVFLPMRISILWLAINLSVWTKLILDRPRSACDVYQPPRPSGSGKSSSVRERTAPYLYQLTASSRRSSPQKSSRPTTNVGEPKVPSSLGRPVSSIRAAFASTVFANARAGSGSTPMSHRIGLAPGLLAKL